jgi:hypothetical protein
MAAEERSKERCLRFPYLIHLPNKLEATKQALGHCALRTGQPELNQAHLSLITWSRPTTNPFLLFSYLPKLTTLIRP